MGISTAPEILVGRVLSDLAKFRNYQTFPINQKHLSKLRAHAHREEAHRFVLATASLGEKIGDLD